MEAILDIVSRITVDYLSRQIEAGVDAVQLFDSWAGSLSPAQFEQLVIARTAWIVAELKKRHPDTPIIGFPKGAGGKLRAYAAETGVDAIGLDETVEPRWAAMKPPGLPVQGNLDPLALIAGGEPPAPRRDASLTHSPTGPTSSTWAMGSSRRRRSRMSRSWSRWRRARG
jgi:uroporphyrinogen decarboxylase